MKKFSTVDNQNLQKAQSIMFEILIEVDKICQKYNIEYWLDGGTLLGAVRHKEFIPWDDDLDVAMKIEDYHTFCRLAKEELPSSMFFQTNETDGSFPYDFAKIRSDNAQIIEEHEAGKKVLYHQGVFIDIFPMISIEKSFYYPFARKLTYMCIKLFSYKYFNIRMIRRWIINYVESLHAGWEKDDNIVIYSGRIPNLNFAIKVSDFFPLSKETFKNKDFPVPKSAHNFLVSLYGKDYMTLPPENKRKTHASKIEIYG